MDWPMSTRPSRPMCKEDLDMKRYNLISLCLVLLAGCSAAEPSLLEGKDVVASTKTLSQTTLNSLKHNVVIDMSMSIGHEFDEEYSSLNYSEYGSISKRFGLVEEGDGSYTRVAENSNLSHTYFEASDGSTYFEAYDKDNKVQKITYYTVLGQKVRFNDTFENPFDYVYLSDFSNNGLSSKKAELVSEKLLGMPWGVDECKVALDDKGRISSLEIEYLPRNDAIYSSSAGYVYYTSTLEATFDFSYPAKKLGHMIPSTESNPELTSAFSSLGSNYTITSYSDSSNYLVKTFVTESGIYQHYYGSQENMTDGDMYLSGRRSYRYTTADGFTQYDIGASNSDFLPSFDSVDGALFHKETSDTYSLVEGARYSNAERFVIPYFDLGSSYYGGYSSVTLKDGKVSRTSTSITTSGGSIVNIVNVYSDYGTTEFPTFFEFENA